MLTLLGLSRVFELFSSTVIGRRDTDGIVVHHHCVSRSHAHIFPRYSGWVIEDLGSLNGTFVNGEEVTSQKTLQNGDIVRLGPVCFTVEVH